MRFAWWKRPRWMWPFVAMAAPAPPQGFVANALAARGITTDANGEIVFDSNSTNLGTTIAYISGDGTGNGVVLNGKTGGTLYLAFAGTSKYRFAALGLSQFAGITTVGLGVPAIYAVASSVGNAALVANAINYVPPAAAGTYRISAYVNVRTAAAVNMTVTVTYKDAAGVARSELLTLQQQNTATNVVNMNNTAGRFTGQYIFQIDNSATAITVSTTGTTMTLYDLAATLEQLA